MRRPHGHLLVVHVADGHSWRGVRSPGRYAAGRGPANPGHRPPHQHLGEHERPGGDQSCATSHTNLIAYTKALEAAGLAIKLVSRVPAPLRPIADQLIRSASSVPANLAEGHGRFGRDRQHHWRIAYASAKEAECHLRLLAAAGAVPGSGVTTALESFDQVRAMTWRLLNPL